MSDKSGNHRTYVWFENNDVVAGTWESGDKTFQDKTFYSDLTQQYFDDYIAIHEHYEGNLFIHSPNITSLGNLKSVSGWLQFGNNTMVVSLGKLESVGGKVYCVMGGYTHKLLMDSEFKNKIHTTPYIPHQYLLRSPVSISNLSWSVHRSLRNLEHLGKLDEQYGIEM